jgi:prefoldin subunit 5
MARTRAEAPDEIAEAQKDFDKAMKRLDSRIKSTDRKLRTFKKLGQELEQVVGQIERLANGKGPRG